MSPTRLNSSGVSGAGCALGGQASQAGVVSSVSVNSAEVEEDRF